MFANERRIMKGLTQFAVLSSTWNEMRVLGLRADGVFFRGLITVKTQTGTANTASVTWSPVTEVEDGSISDMAS
jgi:hypothetical protein